MIQVKFDFREQMERFISQFDDQEIMYWWNRWKQAKSKRIKIKFEKKMFEKILRIKHELKK